MEIAAPVIRDPTPIDPTQKWWYGFCKANHLIGGSYSLFKFLKEHNSQSLTNWSPSDIDIFTEINASEIDDKEIILQLEEWKKMLGEESTLIKISYNDFYLWNKFGKNGFNPPSHIRNYDDRKEDFDKAVVAVGTYHVPNAPRQNVQVVLLDKRIYDALTILDLLSRIADIKVFYKYQDQSPYEKRWYCSPGDTRDILSGILRHMCPHRSEKYKKRGFTIISDQPPIISAQLTKFNVSLDLYFNIVE